MRAASRGVLAQQLRSEKQSLVGEQWQWTTHHIAYEFKSVDFSDVNKLFNRYSPRVELGDGMQGRISLDRKRIGGDIGCDIFLERFVGKDEYTITVMRFGKGAVQPNN